MARMQGVESHEAGWLTRLVYWFVKRSMLKLTGKPELVEPVKIVAHHPRLLKAVAQMEQGQAAANSALANLKCLASIKTSMLVGCPF